MKNKNELSELSSIVDNLLNKVEKLKEGYNILMEHWDSFPEDEKPKNRQKAEEVRVIIWEQRITTSKNI